MKSAARVGWMLVLIVIFGVVEASAQDEMGFTRVKHLRRGINLSMWYAQNHDLYNETGGAEKLASYITADDFKLVHDLGCDHVRVSIDPEPLIADKASGALRPEAMARLDESVKQITATGMVAVLDIHPEDSYVKEVLTNDEATRQFFTFWKSFAQHFAATDPAKVYFEVLNEPHGVDWYKWMGIQARTVAFIRGEVPRHTIIATGASYGNIDALVAMEPVRDDDVIYTFHDYEPMEFTHQGATWAGDSLKSLRGVPYPATPEIVAPLLPGLADDAARKSVSAYAEKGWNQPKMAARIQLAVDWAKARHVPLWCGEFGVYKNFASVEDRARWISDMRTTLEANGIGWDMWDYRGAFGMIAKENGVSKPEDSVVQALGLGGARK